MLMLTQEVIVMKKSVWTLSLFGLLLAGLTFSACTTSQSSKKHTSSSRLEQSNTSSNPSGSKSVQSVELNFSTYGLEVGDQITLRATVYPTTALDRSVSWSSSDESVASVENGTIKAVGAGQATITVTTTDGGHTASCLVTVSEEENPGDDYIPDDTDETILSITPETLDQASTSDEEAGEYEFDVAGTSLTQIYVNVPDKTIVLNLNGATITNSEQSPIYVADCDKIEISAKKNKTNIINDNRPVYTAEDENQGKGAIYVANGDLKLKGAGTLTVNANYYNGIHGKDDVEIQKMTLNVTAPHIAVRGNDSLTVNSGVLNLSCGGDGLHTENSDLSDKGKQRGNITINGGTININSWTDALQASYNVEINETDPDNYPTVLDIKTNTKSSYSGEIVEPEDDTLYLKMSSSIYASGSYTYAAYIDGEFYKANFKKEVTQEGGGGGWFAPGGGGPGGGSSTYYVYEIERPVSATSFVLYRFSGSNVTSFSTSDYNAKSDSTTFNTNYDMVTVSSVSGTKISLGGWSTYDTNGVSSKGIKAENEIIVNAGSITIDAKDDAIHANNDGALENGALPLGNITFNGGSTNVKSGDDGIHADGVLTVNDGTVDVLSSYEGLEGNVININGGTSTVVASDDGVNANSGESTPLINVTGGRLDVTVSPSGNTDGIDANGNITISGGIVITRGPNSSNMSPLDFDGTCNISGGITFVIGYFNSSIKSSLTKSSLSSGLTSGSHTLSVGGSSYTYSNSYSYSGKATVLASSSATIS